jgi:hypothetical protein
MAEIDRNEVIDLRKLPALLDWPSAIEHLHRLRDELESFLAPHVTTKRTRLVLAFRGKRRYLKLPAKVIVKSAAHSLSWLYRVLDAIEANDVDQMIRTLIYFSKADSELWACMKTNISFTEALALQVHSKKAQSDAGKQTKELTKDSELLLLRSTFAKHQSSTSRFQKTADELYDRHGIKGRRGKKLSARTISRRLKELGILDNGSVVPGQR